MNNSNILGALDRKKAVWRDRREVRVGRRDWLPPGSSLQAIKELNGVADPG